MQNLILIVSIFLEAVSNKRGYRIHPFASGFTDTLRDCQSIIIDNGPQHVFNRCVVANQNKMAKMVEKLMESSKRR